MLISDVAQLQLDTQGYLVEQGSTMNLTVTAFDMLGKEFDADQYALMDFALEIEMTGLHRSKGLLAHKVRGMQRLFTVTGVEPGNYVVTAYIEKALMTKVNGTMVRERITSEANKIEVFPILTLVPS